MPESPSYLDQRALLLRHHAEMVEREGERCGTVAMRKFAVRYLTGIPGARVFRDLSPAPRPPPQFREVVGQLLHARGTHNHKVAEVAEETCAPL